MIDTDYKREKALEWCPVEDARKSFAQSHRRYALATGIESV